MDKLMAKINYDVVPQNPQKNWQIHGKFFEKIQVLFSFSTSVLSQVALKPLKKKLLHKQNKKWIKIKNRKLCKLFRFSFLQFWIFFLSFFRLLSLTPFQFTHIFISLKLKSDWSKTNIIKLDTKYEHKTWMIKLNSPTLETQIDFRENGKIASERKCNFDRVTYIYMKLRREHDSTSSQCNGRFAIQKKWNETNCTGEKLDWCIRRN